MLYILWQVCVLGLPSLQSAIADVIAHVTATQASLLRLRGTAKSEPESDQGSSVGGVLSGGMKGMSDMSSDDKCRLQLWIDVREMHSAITEAVCASLGLDTGLPLPPIDSASSTSLMSSQSGKTDGRGFIWNHDQVKESVRTAMKASRQHSGLNKHERDNEVEVESKDGESQIALQFVECMIDDIHAVLQRLVATVSACKQEHKLWYLSHRST